MLKNFENWLLENNYSASTSADYMGRIERLCRKEEFTLAYAYVWILRRYQYRLEAGYLHHQ